MPVVHDRELFQRVLSRARALEPEIRPGSMFGCPAAFVGKKLAFCVYGAEIGAKVPEANASTWLASGAAASFTPYGKKKMREWIALSATVEERMLADVLAAALAYARELDASG